MEIRERHHDEDMQLRRDADRKEEARAERWEKFQQELAMYRVQMDKERVQANKERVQADKEIRMEMIAAQERGDKRMQEAQERADKRMQDFMMFLSQRDKK